MTDAPLDLNAIETSMSNLRVRYHRGQHDGLFEDQEIIASALLVEVRRLRERVEDLGSDTSRLRRIAGHPPEGSRCG